MDEARLPHVEAPGYWCQNRMYELGPAGQSLVRCSSADHEVVTAMFWAVPGCPSVGPHSPSNAELRERKWRQ
jgi:hypothetical protein